jgi:hypothetical protein
MWGVILFEPFVLEDLNLFNIFMSLGTVASERAIGIDVLSPFPDKESRHNAGLEERAQR